MARMSPLRVGLLSVTAIGAYGIATYVSYSAYRIYSKPMPPPGCHEPQNQRWLAGVYDALAPEYDAKMAWDEWLIGVDGLRRKLLKEAKGDVLEVSAGTGRNFGSYDPQQLKSLTLTDSSADMLRQALSKWRSDYRNEFRQKRRQPQMALFGKKDAVESGELEPSFVVMNSERLQFGDGTFDTVVDTFGLCSHADPVQALREMRRVCRMDGRVLLLEHGRCEHDGWMNVVLDKLAGDHAVAWGCWWNRDVSGMLRAAGLQVRSVEKKHFGTTFIVVAAPSERPSLQKESKSSN